ncbi:MAG: Sapep family Mn(2+)-dependent dipeptidase [Candidatus Sumerlaeaceae bacterium]|nr:Sapep family Mn(2+)-dependent dipeptidase [Candidatus Sumerlaeaceae bacterium]
MTDTSLKQRIEELVEQNKDAITADLQELLRFRTVSGGATDEAEALYLSETERCLKFLEGKATEMGLGWRNHDNKVAVMQLGENEKFIGLPVHVDVVPVGDGWTHGPFDGKVADGYIWGRGCQDDKGPVIQVLWAVNIVRLLGGELSRGARLIIGTKEECGDWADIKHYFKVEPEPEFSIVSDAGFPIINGEKGMMNLRVEGKIPRDEEPNVGGYRFLSATAGERANIVPDQALLTFEGDTESDAAQLEKELNRFLMQHIRAAATVSKSGNNAVITFTGRAAHGSTPQEGHNAALDLLLFMTESGFVTDDEADMAQFLHEVASDLTGARLDIAMTHHFIGSTTVNLGILDWKGAEIKATLNIRNTMGLLTSEAEKRAQKHFAEFAEETGFDVTAKINGRAVEPIFLDPEQYPDFINTLKEAYTTMTGRESKLVAIGGTTYAKAFPRAVVFGPVEPEDGEEELAHQVNERVKVDHMMRNVKIYAYALARLCAS